MKREIIGIDIFCGAGGLTYGLKEAGINVIKGVDVDETSRETYLKNNRGASFIAKDVRKLTKDELIGDTDRSKNLLLLAGCAPCQPFSAQNKAKTPKDTRRSLIMDFFRLVKEILPEYVLVENVPGFMKKNNRYHTKFVKNLSLLGYDYVEKVINAADYGVPQKRLRYVLLASRLGKIDFPPETHGPGRQAYKTVADAIAKYPKIRAGSFSRTVPNHISKSLSETNMVRIKAIPKNGGSRRDLPKKLVLECHKNYKGHSDVYGRMSFDKPAPTLTCRCTSFTNGRFGHPVQNRPISLREAAAIQTFPDDYIFYSPNMTKAAVHIGNAVPVLLAEKLGETIVTNAAKQSV